MRLLVLHSMRSWPLCSGALLALVVVLASPAGAFDARQIYRKAAAGVVYIQGAERSPSGVASGTGAIIRDDGHILTNANVVTSSTNSMPTIVVALKPETVTGDLSRYIRAEIVARSDRFLEEMRSDLQQR